MEDIDVTTVRKIFKAAENKIFDYLSSTTPTDNVIVKILKGLYIEGRYLPGKKIHTYDDIVCKERIWSKAKVTRYYNRKINRNRE